MASEPDAFTGGANAQTERMRAEMAKRTAIHAPKTRRFRERLSDEGQERSDDWWWANVGGPEIGRSRVALQRMATAIEALRMPVMLVAAGAFFIAMAVLLT